MDLNKKLRIMDLTARILFVIFVCVVAIRVNDQLSNLTLENKKLQKQVQECHTKYLNGFMKIDDLSMYSGLKEF